MEAHPKYHEVADVCQKVPSRARILFQTYMDLKYAQLYRSVEACMVDSLNRPVVETRGLDSSRQVFMPVFANESFNLDDLQDIFEKLQASLTNNDDPESQSKLLVHLAIVETDSTIVYYKIGQDLSFSAIPNES